MAIKTLLPGSGTDLSFGATLAAGDSIKSLFGNQTVTTVDLSALAQLLNVTFGKQTGLKFGSNVKLGATGKVTWAGQTGSLPIEAANIAGGGTANTIARLVAIGQGIVAPSAGTFTRAEMRSGEIDTNASAIIPTFVACGGTSNTLFITGASGFQFAVFSGGNHTTGRGLDSDFASPRMVVCGGAKVTVGRTDITDAILATNDATVLPTGTGATASGIIGVYGAPSSLDWQGITIDRLEVFGGARVDMTKAPISFTVTNLHVDWKSLFTSSWRAATNGVTITYTNLFIYAADDDTLPN